MKLFTKQQYNKLLSNGRKQADAIEQGESLDFKPVVKLFNPTGVGTWLLSEIDPDYLDIAFGLCDVGYPELGSVSISELENFKGVLGLGIERDLSFSPTKTLIEYSNQAREAGSLIA